MAIATKEQKEQLRNQLEEKSDDGNGYGENWDPDPGDILIGRLQDVVTVSTRYGERDVARIETEEGVLSVWLKHKVLRDEWQALAPAPGDLLGIRFIDEKSSQNGSYYDYNVEVLSDSSESESNKQALDEEPATDEVPF